MTRTDVLLKILDEVKYRDWIFDITEKLPDVHLLHVSFIADNEPNKPQVSRKYYISPFATKSEVVQTAFLAVKVALEHELREEFTYKGEAIFGPHFDCEELRELAEKKMVDIRAEKALGL